MIKRHLKLILAVGAILILAVWALNREHPVKVSLATADANSG